MSAHAPMTWSDVMGDDELWIRHVPVAWQAAATEATDAPVPDRPLEGSEETIAYWAPLLHLLVYGLGWTRPDIGLAAWADRRLPLDEPILRIVHRWWGPSGVRDVLAWFALNGGIAFHIATHADFHSVARPPGDRRFQDMPKYEQLRQTAEWQRVWGGGTDAMHLTHHIGSPLVPSVPHNPSYFDERWVDEHDVDALPRFTIVNDAYSGWYSDFFHYFPSDGLGPNGRSVRVDRFVKPIGWLGEYRQHKQTGLWFRGRSAVHLWGQ